MNRTKTARILAAILTGAGFILGVCTAILLFTTKSWLWGICPMLTALVFGYFFFQDVIALIDTDSKTSS